MHWTQTKQGKLNLAARAKRQWAKLTPQQRGIRKAKLRKGVLQYWAGKRAENTIEAADAISTTPHNTTANGVVDFISLYAIRHGLDTKQLFSDVAVELLTRNLTG